MSEREEDNKYEIEEADKSPRQHQENYQEKGKQSISTIKEEVEQSASEKITENDFNNYESSQDEKKIEKPIENDEVEQKANFGKKQQHIARTNAEFQNQNDEAPAQSKDEAAKKEAVANENQVSKVNKQEDKPQTKDIVQEVVPWTETPKINSEKLIKEAENERMGSIFKNFNEYYRKCRETLSSYKLILNNVCISITNKVEFKKQLEEMLLEYFDDYAKVHRHFHDKTIKISKEEEPASVNKFVNIKEELRKGFEELVYLRRNLGVNAEKLDGYIANHINKSIKLAFSVYREDIHAYQRGQALTIREQFQAEEKIYKKLIALLEKICRKGMEGDKYKEDIFVELVAYVQQERVYRQALKKYGKTMVSLRKNYISSEKKLFSTLQNIMNEFKNEQKTVYAAQPEYNKVLDYTQFIEDKTTFEELCTITDSDFIKAVLELQNRKERVQFKNEHFEEFLEMDFFERIVGNSNQMLKNASTKTFAMKKSNMVLIHTLSENLVEFDKQKNQCLQKYDISHLDARIFAEGTVQFEIVSGFIFKDKKIARVELRDSDVADELIGYLNTMQEIKGTQPQK